jgi:hypothetical protein
MLARMCGDVSKSIVIMEVPDKVETQEIVDLC